MTRMLSQIKIPSEQPPYNSNESIVAPWHSAYVSLDLKAALQKDPQKHSLPVQQPTAQCVQSSTAAKWSPSTAQSFVTIPPTAHGHSLTHCYTTLVSLSKLDPSFPLDDIVPSHLFLSPLKTKQNHTSFTSLYRSL